MGNKKCKINLIQKIEQSITLKMVTCLIMSLIVIALFFIINGFVEIKNSRKYIITNDIKVINQIEDISNEDNKINIRGYAFLVDMDSTNAKISMLLRNINDKEEFWLDVEQISRKDIDLFFGYDLSFENSGFNASIKDSKLKDDECYEIIIKLDYVFSEQKNNIVSKTVSTNKYIVNRKLYSYNPIDFEHPNIESDLLRGVFNNGQLCFYQKDKGIYVYQYNDQLYWIADEYFNFNEDGMTSIPCNAYTSILDRLPESRMNSGFETLGFLYEEYEYTYENIAPYRVAIWDIPSDYPIIYIITGEYNSGWIWNKSFHINYTFD